MKKRRVKQTVAMTAICLFAGGVMPLSVQAAVENGWEVVDGNWYWYENGVKQGLEGRGKEIFDKDSNAWYWLDSDADGKKATSKDLYQESDAGQWAEKEDGTGKWVRYDENGHMIKGWDTNENGTYYFDLTYGTMAKGEGNINGITYYFNEGSGILESSTGNIPGNANGWHTIDGIEYWYENGVRQGLEGRGKEIFDPSSNAWYWLDSIDMGKKAVSKDVYQESQADDAGNIGKWVRYDENGHMIKGWDEVDGNKYYFDLTYGTMTKGEKEIDGITYIFNQETGILEGEKQPDNSENETPKEEHALQYAFDDNNMTATLTGVENSMSVEEVIIPSEVTVDGKTYTVTAIAREVFASAYSLTKVEIPDTVTSIGDNAFAWCHRLESINLPANLTNLEAWAFLGCSALTELVIPDSLTMIDYSVFNGCSGLRKVHIPDTVTSIADNAFDDCVSLTDIVIPDSVTSISSDSFFGVANIVFENPEAYDSVGGARAVDGYIEGDVVYKDSSKKELLAVLGYVSGKFTVPDSVTVIGDYAFLDCRNLTEIEIPSSVTSIGEEAFVGCKDLTEITVPNSVTEIGQNAFEEIAHITYNGTATGSPWGANAMN